MMSFLTLQDQLREHIRARIRRRELTGSGLARAAGFPQGHLSNFLNLRRGLSLESMDRLLATLGISVLDLISQDEIQQRVALSLTGGQLEQVPLVSAEHAMLARFTPEQVWEMRGFRRAFLRRLSPSQQHHRSDWQRFVVIKIDMQQARDVFASDAVSATLLVDRHYTSLRPYRRVQPNLYVANVAGRLQTGYLSLVGENLVLRTRDPRCELRTIAISPSMDYASFIVGRVCHVALEM